MEKAKRKSGVLLPGLKRARTRRGLTQTKFAEKAGVERATVSNLENLKQSALPLTVEKLARALEVDPEELMSAPKDQPTLFPTSPEDRGVVYLQALRRLLDRMDRRLEEAIESDGADMALAEWAAQVERDIWERVVPEMRLMHGVGGMPKGEAEAHELVYATLISLGSTVQEAYTAAVRKLTGQEADVVGFDRLRAAMEERERARSEGRQRIEEARTA